MLVYLSLIETEEDKCKFIQIYSDYRGLMYNVAYQILHHTQDSEDAVHQAFVNIAANIDIINDDDSSKLKGLVVTIARRCAIDLYRKKSRTLTISLEDCFNLPDEYLIEYKGSNRLAQCIAKLPANYREIILLKHCYGYSPKEISKILGITEANAYKILQRAKNRLEILCREEGLL